MNNMVKQPKIQIAHTGWLTQWLTPCNSARAQRLINSQSTPLRLLLNRLRFRLSPFLSFLLIVIFGSFTTQLAATSVDAAPVKIIFDTDMGNDVDDALALSMLHSLQSRGECELLAITITKSHPDVAPYIDALNTFYGRGNIPIGTTSSGITPEASTFTEFTKSTPGLEMPFPHDLTDADQAPPAVSLLRKTLSNQPDNSVVIIQVGFSTNLAALIETPSDQYSPLSGLELVKQKVKFISIMAGAFEPVWEKTHLEYNVVNDIPAAQRLAENWPTTIYWSGFEVGLAIRYPASSILQDFSYHNRHPIVESYQRYKPTPHERPTWDLTSVLYAIRPERGYFELSEPGAITVLDSGETQFQPSRDGRDYYLRLDKNKIQRIKENMTLLVSEPPNLSRTLSLQQGVNESR